MPEMVRIGDGNTSTVSVHPVAKHRRVTRRYGRVKAQGPV